MEVKKRGEEVGRRARELSDESMHNYVIRMITKRPVASEYEDLGSNPGWISMSFFSLFLK